jgi:hypothetical protein
MPTIMENATEIFSLSSRIENYGDTEAKGDLEKIKRDFDITYPLASYVSRGLAEIPASRAAYTTCVFEEILDDLKNAIESWTDRKDPDRKIKQQIADIIVEEEGTAGMGPFGSHHLFTEKLDIEHTANNILRWYVYYLTEWTKAYPQFRDR